MGDDNSTSSFGTWLQGLFGGNQQQQPQATAPQNPQTPGAQQPPMTNQQMAGFGLNMLAQNGNSMNQQAQQLAHTPNMVGQGNPQNGQMLQALMQPMQMANHAMQNQMNPQAVTQSLMNPQSSLPAL